MQTIAPPLRSRFLLIRAFVVPGLLLLLGTSAHAQSISAGFSHTCAIKGDGTVGCWGNGNDGELGDGLADDRRTVGTVTGLSDVVQVDAGPYVPYSCAVRGDGTVACWGSGKSLRLGNGATTNANTPVDVTGLTNATRVTTAAQHTCALKNDGTVVCWGSGTNGLLGFPATADAPAPVAVPGLTDVVSLSAGGAHTCAVRGAGTVVCWGWILQGDGTTSPATTPTAVAGLTNAVSVSAGESSTCALKSDGTVSCWGSSFRGQLGNGGMADSSTPVDVAGLSGVKAVSAGGNHVCALKDDGTVFCWGYGEFGQLGFGGTPLAQPTPVQVSGLTNAVSVEAGHEHTCAIRSDGSAVCWGNGDDGRLGTGEKSQRNVPALVLNLTATGTEDEAADPVSFALLPIYPDPARETATLTYRLPAAGAVRVEVFNMLGQRVATLVDGTESAGLHTATLDTRRLAAGLYVLHAEAAGQVLTRSLTVLH